MLGVENSVCLKHAVVTAQSNAVRRVGNCSRCDRCAAAAAMNVRFKIRYDSDHHTALRHCLIGPIAACSLHRIGLSAVHCLACSRYVSFESRNGTCCRCGFASAFITDPSVSSELLMLVASLNCCPCAPDFLIRSQPARSTRDSMPVVSVTLTFDPRDVALVALSSCSGFVARMCLPIRT